MFEFLIVPLALLNALGSSLYLVEPRRLPVRHRWTFPPRLFLAPKKMRQTLPLLNITLALTDGCPQLKSIPGLFLKLSKLLPVHVQNIPLQGYPLLLARTEKQITHPPVPALQTARGVYMWA